MAKAIVPIILILFIASCVSLPDRTDLVNTQFTLDVMPLSDPTWAKCDQQPNAVACGRTDHVYIQGKPAQYELAIPVQFLSWNALWEQCNAYACIQDGTLFTYPYLTYEHDLEMGIIGDLLVNEFDIIDIGFNRRTNLGHEFMAHVAGLGHPRGH